MTDPARVDSQHYRLKLADGTSYLFDRSVGVTQVLLLDGSHLEIRKDGRPAR